MNSHIPSKLMGSEETLHLPPPLKPNEVSWFQQVNLLKFELPSGLTTHEARGIDDDNPRIELRRLVCDFLDPNQHLQHMPSGSDRTHEIGGYQPNMLQLLRR